MSMLERELMGLNLIILIIYDPEYVEDIVRSLSRLIIFKPQQLGFKLKLCYFHRAVFHKAHFYCRACSLSLHGGKQKTQTKFQKKLFKKKRNYYFS